MDGADILVLLPALFFAGMGALALAMPTLVVDRFGVAVTSIDGRNEIRSVYGGFGLAVAALLVWAALTEGRGQLWIPSVIAVLCFGMAVGRLVSLALDRTSGSAVVWRYVALELALAVALFASHTLR
ncbi:MAG: DUF4345 family protein [Nocardioides sp.]